jgi:hypothetical protein
MTVTDTIYFNTRGNEFSTWVWAYYRITSKGQTGDNIEVCLLKWPSFEDINIIGDEHKAVVVNPADTGYNSAYPNVCELLKNKWGIDHEKSILIGLRPRDV